MNNDQLEHLRQLLERGREPTKKISALRKTVLLIKAKLARHTAPEIAHPETKKKDAA